MNTFFYAARKTAEADLFAEKLLTCKSLADLRVLSAGKNLCCSQALSLRSGDVMILFAHTESELTSLITEHDSFLEFRIILILGTDLKQRTASHSLRPRYISEMESTVKNIEKVVAKIQSHTTHGTAASP